MNLTAAQQRVVSLLLEGATYAVIAKRCGISPRTVEKHVEQAARRLPGSQPPRTRILLFAAGRLPDA